MRINQRWFEHTNKGGKMYSNGEIIFSKGIPFSFVIPLNIISGGGQKWWRQYYTLSKRK
jgi:hypothetical protein